jgi:hypothetical protein
VVSAPPEPAGGAGRALRSGARGELWAFLELLALCGFVVVQPLLDVVGGSPDFFIFHGVTGAEIMLVVALFTLVPPAGLWALGALSGLAGDRFRTGVHLVTVGLLAVLFMIQLGKYTTSLRGAVLALLAGFAAVLVVAGYARYEAVRHLLRFAAVGPLVFVLLFAFGSPSSAVVFASGTPALGGDARVVGPAPPVVLVVLDELPLTSLLDADGSIDARRYPNFARLAGDSTWYRNASSVAGWTPYALPAMLSGVFPAEHVAPHYSRYPDNLFTLLGDAYRMETSESITELCPPWQCGDLTERSRGRLATVLADSSRLLGEILSPADPARDPGGDLLEPTLADQPGAQALASTLGPEFRFDQTAVNQPVRFQQFLRALEQPATGSAAAPPTLHFLHLLLPHNPYRYLPSGMRYPYVRMPVEGGWWGRLTLQRLELQLEYTDRLLGELLDTLERSGRYHDSLLVVTSDHGVSLDPAAGKPRDGLRTVPWRELGPDDAGATESVWVPLFIKEPGQTSGVVDDRNWQHVDLLPTLADLIGVEVPWKVDGISWLREERTDPVKTFYSELDDVRELDGPALFARILAAPDAIPPLPPAPLPHLVGTAVSDYPVIDGPSGGEVDNADAFADVRPQDGVVPALVYGTVPAAVPEGTPLAIAVNGRIGAVALVMPGTGGSAHRFAGLVADETLFRAGENRLELFLVTGTGTALRRLAFG